MKIKSIKTEQKKFSFAKPIKTAKGILSERIVFYIYLQNCKGKWATGEAAPLEGFSKENLKEVEKQIKIGFGKILNIELSTISDFENLIANKFNLLPTVRFALSSAFLKLWMKEKLPLPGKLNIKETEIIKLKSNALIDAGVYNIANEIKKAKNKNYDTVKIKVSSNTDIDNLVNEIKNQKINFRIDPNGAWDFKEAKSNLIKLDLDNIEYVEDPTPDFEANLKLAEKFKKVALDNTASNIEEYEIALSKGVNNFVIKPAFLGSVFQIIEFIQKAKQTKAKIIVSSAFESNVAREMVYFIASFLFESTHGLALKEILTEDDNTKYKINEPYLYFNKNKFYGGL